MIDRRKMLFTLATLPIAAEQGTVAEIVDSTTTQFGAAAESGGVDSVLVRFNGRNWLILCETDGNVII